MPCDGPSECLGILTLICHLADFTNTFRSLASVQPEDSSDDLPGPLQEVGAAYCCLSHYVVCPLTPVIPCPLAFACHTPAPKLLPLAPYRIPSLVCFLPIGPAFSGPAHHALSSCGPCLSGPAHQPLSTSNPCLCLLKQLQAGMKMLAAALLTTTLQTWSAAVSEAACGITASCSAAVQSINTHIVGCMTHIQKQCSGAQQFDWKGFGELRAAHLQDNNQQRVLAIRKSSVSWHNNQQCLFAVRKTGVAQHSLRVGTKARKQKLLLPAIPPEAAALRVHWLCRQ